MLEWRIVYLLNYRNSKKARKEKSEDKPIARISAGHRKFRNRQKKNLS